MFNKLVILDYENKKIIFSKCSSTDTTEDIEEYITETLGLKPSAYYYMVADEIEVEY